MVGGLWTGNRIEGCRPALVAMNSLHQLGVVDLFYALPRGPVGIRKHRSPTGDRGIPCSRTEGSPLAIVVSPLAGKVTMYYFEVKDGNRLPYPTLASVVLPRPRASNVY